MVEAANQGSHPIFSYIIFGRLPFNHCPPVASQNSSSVLSQLKCQLCSNLLTQPLELPCSALVCTKCIVEWVAATGAENCSCYSDDDPLLSSWIRPASDTSVVSRYSGALCQPQQRCEGSAQVHTISNS